MRNNNTFIIESERSRHKLMLNGQEFGTFATLDAAEREAAELANRAAPGTTLRFQLDFKWTLSDLELRVATFQLEGKTAADYAGRDLAVKD